jgi:hypothetical protein
MHSSTKKTALTIASVLALAGTSVAIPTNVASAAESGTHKVSCTGAHHVLVLSSTHGRYCYQGSGSISVSISNVYSYESSVSGHMWVATTSSGWYSVNFYNGDTKSPVWSRVSSISIN